MMKETIELKQGLARDYIVETEPLTKLLGKIEIGESIRTNSMQKMQLVCSYDEYSSNNSHVLEAVMKLPLKYREVIHLFYYEDYTTARIAEVIGKKESTVRSLLHRARNILKDTLKEEYDFEQ